jgi:hypothetical protein
MASASPLELLAGRWDAAGRSRLREILRRHGFRLTPSELRMYEEAAVSGSGPALTALRKRLLNRLWRDATLRRHRSPMVFANRETEFGPYNDRVALEDALQRTATADPGWVREFLDLYLRMERLRTSFLALIPVNR